MSEFDKIIKLIQKHDQAFVEKKIYDDFAEGLDEKVENKQYRQREKNKIKKFAREVAAMANCILVAREGRGLKYCATKSRISIEYLKTFLRKGEEALNFCNSFEGEDGEIMEYQEHEDYIYIEFYLDFEEARNQKINEREDIIDEQSTDLVDKEGNIIRTGSWKAAQYMLEVKDKEQYKEVAENIGAGLGEGAGVVIINQPSLSQDLTHEEQLIELENIAKSSQSNFIEHQQEKINEIKKQE